MEGETGGLAGSGTAILVIVAYLGTMLLAGLMTAAFRVGGLYRNGLLEAERLGRVLQGYLQATRHFIVILNTLFLVLAVLGCHAWGHLLASWWTGDLTLRFYLVLVGAALLAWYGGSLLVYFLAEVSVDDQFGFFPKDGVKVSLGKDFAEDVQTSRLKLLAQTGTQNKPQGGLGCG